MYSKKILRKVGELKMPKQYTFEVRRPGKKTVKVYNICHDDEAAIAWLKTQARLWDWGEHGIDYTVRISSRPLSEIHETDADRVGYLCEITEEIFAREISNNCPNTSLRELSWNDLCQTAIEILESLKGADKNVAL